MFKIKYQWYWRSSNEQLINTTQIMDFFFIKD